MFGYPILSWVAISVIITGSYLASFYIGMMTAKWHVHTGAIRNIMRYSNMGASIGVVLSGLYLTTLVFYLSNQEFEAKRDSIGIISLLFAFMISGETLAAGWVFSYLPYRENRKNVQRQAAYRV